MRLIPLRFGEIPLKSSRIDFMCSLRDLTERDYPLVPMIIADTHKLKDYGIEIYDEGFMLFRIQKHAFWYTFFFTTVHCRVIERKSGLFLKYHIRLNLFSNLMVLIVWCAMCYMLYHDIFIASEFSFTFWLCALFINVSQAFGFYADSKADGDFLTKLVNHKV